LFVCDAAAVVVFRIDTRVQYLYLDLLLDSYYTGGHLSGKYVCKLVECLNTK
jgi:hypothetical protein